MKRGMPGTFGGRAYLWMKNITGDKRRVPARWSGDTGRRVWWNFQWAPACAVCVLHRSAPRTLTSPHCPALSEHLASESLCTYMAFSVMAGRLYSLPLSPGCGPLQAFGVPLASTQTYLLPGVWGFWVLSCTVKFPFVFSPFLLCLCLGLTVAGTCASYSSSLLKSLLRVAPAFWALSLSPSLVF